MINKSHKDVCPHCGSENLKVHKQGDQQFVYCYDCDGFYERPKIQSYVSRRLSGLGRPYHDSDPDDSPDGETYPE